MKIDWMKLKEQSKKYIGCNLILLLCGVLALTFFVVAIVSLFSVGNNQGIAVKEAFDVSSAPLDTTNQNFVSQLSGYIINYEDEKAVIESIIIVVGNGREREEVTLDGLKLYPRLPEEIRHEWKTGFDFSRIHSVSVVIDGERQLLANSTAEWEFNPNVILYAFLCALACFGTVFTFKKRYYRYQEDLMAERVDEVEEAPEETIEEVIEENPEEPVEVLKETETEE